MSKKMVNLTRHLVYSMTTHALKSHPYECCGLVGGRGTLFSSWYPLQNEAPFPRRQYAVAPSELFQTMRCMRHQGETNLGIYHSHPSSSAYPSNTDINLAFYPEAIYFILAFYPSLHLCAYSIVQQQVEAVEIRIFD